MRKGIILADNIKDRELCIAYIDYFFVFKKNDNWPGYGKTSNIMKQFNCKGSNKIKYNAWLLYMHRLLPLQVIFLLDNVIADNIGTLSNNFLIFA